MSTTVSDTGRHQVASFYETGFPAGEKLVVDHRGQSMDIVNPHKVINVRQHINVAD